MSRNIVSASRRRPNFLKYSIERWAVTKCSIFIEPFILAKSNLADLDDLVYHAEIDKIIATSRRNNLRDGVTGALLYSRGHFVQVLEGPRAMLITKLACIEMDVRHSDFKMLDFGPISTNAFPNWPMAFSGTSATQGPLVGRMLERATVYPTEVCKSLTAFLKQSVWQDEGAMKISA